MKTRAAGAILALALLTVAGATTAQAATPPPVTEATVSTHLTGPQLNRWKHLSKAQQRTTTRALSDPSFGVPAKAAALENTYPGLEVTTDTGESAVAALATVSRTSWVRQNWTIFGITYNEVKTTMGYTTSGSRVLDVTRCYGTYVNFLPTRSISSSSWYTLGNGLADCWTEWTLGIPFQSTRTGYQGLRVNGYGQILKVWYV